MKDNRPVDISPVDISQHVDTYLAFGGRWLGWNTEQWELAETWSKETFGGWVTADRAQLRLLYRYAHAGADPVPAPRYQIELIWKGSPPSAVLVNEYALSVTGLKYRDLVTKDEVAYPIDVFKEVRVRDKKEKRA